MIALLGTTIISFTYARVNNVLAPESENVTEQEENFNSRYFISGFEKKDGERYVAKAFNKEGLFGYVIVTERQCKCLCLNELSTTEVAELGTDYDYEDRYNIEVGKFEFNNFSLNELEKGFSSTTVNRIPVVINGKNCIMAILNDGTYAVVENGSAITTHITNRELLKNY